MREAVLFSRTRKISPRMRCADVIDAGAAGATSVSMPAEVHVVGARLCQGQRRFGLAVKLRQTIAQQLP
jgi:hypothetical protein